MGAAQRGPVHTADEAINDGVGFGSAACKCLEDFKHPLLIEVPLAKIRFRVGAQVQLAAATGRFTSLLSNVSKVVLPQRFSGDSIPT